MCFWILLVVVLISVNVVHYATMGSSSSNETKAIVSNANDSTFVQSIKYHLKQTQVQDDMKYVNNFGTLLNENSHLFPASSASECLPIKDGDPKAVKKNVTEFSNSMCYCKKAYVKMSSPVSGENNSMTELVVNTEDGVSVLLYFNGSMDLSRNTAISFYYTPIGVNDDKLFAAASFIVNEVG